jgi:hypothetical protein
MDRSDTEQRRNAIAGLRVTQHTLTSAAKAIGEAIAHLGGLPTIDEVRAAIAEGDRELADRIAELEKTLPRTYDPTA